MDCVFCSIVQKKIPATIVYQDDNIIAFDDIHPRAPIHKLIIPRKHIATINDVAEHDQLLVGQMVYIAKQLAKENNIEQDGYRLVFNCNANAGQDVFHIHLHLLGGRHMTWPPG